MDAQERFPCVTIRFCTQCRWMLRAAYYAQELLSTFSTSLGQVSLQPSTGGIFTITIQTSSSPDVAGMGTATGTGEVQVLWDRKRDGGFPEVKDLKRRVRDVVEPGRNLGHVDRGVSGTGSSVREKESEGGEAGEGTAVVEGGGKVEGKCEDCV
ncbi:hypothetical protein E4U52_004775 [Claviceps spartinae]|nr:hypothetical protein E4U52_004775 [Claviceps spartinae]KAG6100935.1 hypothetical protein E4U30_003448 [Claviceps sp. LM220 group G6]KAG6117252.1 hypothetical protein E4U14_007947 [Claviceps sp. LM454 group G7]